jgi:hypothetical protein
MRLQKFDRVKTAVEIVQARRELIESMLPEFLLERSGIEDRKTPKDGMIIVGTNAWRPLDDRGRALQSQLLAEEGRLEALVRPGRAIPKAQSVAREETACKSAETRAAETVDLAVLDAALRARRRPLRLLAPPCPRDPGFVATDAE